MRATSYWLALILALTLAPLAALPVAGEDRDSTGFLTGPNDGEPEDIAIAYLKAKAETYGLSSTDVAELAVRSTSVSRHTGATHVNINQRFEGLEVFGADTTVTVAADGSVAHVGGASASGLAAASASAALDAVDAVEAAADGLRLDEPEGLRAVSRARTSAQETVLTDGGISDAPIPARLGWQPSEDGLRLAWQLVIDDSSDVHLWNATVDAGTGELLEVDDWTSQDSLHELGDRLGRQGGRSAAAANLAASGDTGLTKHESLNPVQDGSSYRAYPGESPDDTDRVLFTNPADGTASPFGWHDTDGAAGPEYTITRGNNVSAYTDRDNNGNPDPTGEPDGGPGLDFDFPIDLNEHPQYNVPANITNLFRWCNVTHDLFYLYGFDEANSNFQVNNYGRGGVGGDDVRCEGMDGSGENNANFSTPAQDGGRPRMQTFIEFGSGLPSAVTVSSGPAAGTYLGAYARFTPPATTAGTSGTLVLANDGTGNANDGCEPFSLPAGAIAVLDVASGCNNYTQVANAEAAGAVAAVVIHTGTNPTLMSGSMEPPIMIPAIRVGSASGATLKAALATSTAPARVHRNTARPPMRVGDLDTATILHEYSHGVSNRLTGGPNINCLGGNPEQMGEGWGDYHAIVGLLDLDKDDPENARGIYPYVIFEAPRSEHGLRNAPYSRNWDIQPFSYASIRQQAWTTGGSLSQPHGIGHGWAAILWDMTWDLIEKHGFNQNLYEPWNTGGNNLSYQLVMDGLKLQGCSPGFVAGRDGILAADQLLTGGQNQCTVWAAFARRGVGYSASQGETNVRNDNTEAFDTHPACRKDFRAPVRAPYGQMNTVDAGDTVPLKFDLGSKQGLDVLASNSPFSRRVDCDTLQVPSQNPERVTPREAPVPTVSPGNSTLSVSGNGVYHYNWATDADWAGTCRELVLTRIDGVQHRAFFRFVD